VRPRGGDRPRVAIGSMGMELYFVLIWAVGYGNSDLDFGV
jgi:hypothetical protein